MEHLALQCCRCCALAVWRHVDISLLTRPSQSTSSGVPFLRALQQRLLAFAACNLTDLFPFSSPASLTHVQCIIGFARCCCQSQLMPLLASFGLLQHRTLLLGFPFCIRWLGAMSALCPGQLAQILDQVLENMPQVFELRSTIILG